MSATSPDPGRDPFDGLDRGELPDYPRPDWLSEYPDWFNPDENQVVVSKSENGSEHIAHVPDVNSSEPAPVCDRSRGHPHPEKGFRAPDVSVFVDVRACSNCPWGVTWE